MTTDESKDTIYKILESSDGQKWSVSGERLAVSAAAAVKAFADTEVLANGDASHYFVAVPKRSWKPVKRLTKTVTQTTFEEA